MAPYKPDFILTNCPGCPMFLDRWQYVLSEMEGITYGGNGLGIPVLTYEELAGLVLGYDPWDIGLQVHQVPVEPLLDKIGIPYDPVKKFLTLDNRNIGQPVAPAHLKFYQHE
jgi:heterodisulfide reductase subunit B